MPRREARKTDAAHSGGKRKASRGEGGRGEVALDAAASTSSVTVEDTSAEQDADPSAAIAAAKEVTKAVSKKRRADMAMDDRTGEQGGETDAASVDQDRNARVADGLMGEQLDTTTEGDRHEAQAARAVASSSRKPLESLSAVPGTSMLADASPALNHTFLLNRHFATTERVEVDESEQGWMDMVIDQVKVLLAGGQGGYSVVDQSHRSRYNASTTSSAECFMGPVQAQRLQTLPVNTAGRLAELAGDEGKPGCLFNVGSHVYSLDWCPKKRGEAGSRQYLCISSSLEEKPCTRFGEKVSSSSTLARVQIWSVDEDFESRLELVLCFDHGRISSVRWLPVPTSMEESGTLGLLSTCMQDGSVGVYAVPRAESVYEEGRIKGKAGPPTYLSLEPLTRLDIRKGVPTTLEWFNADKVAVAYSDGWLSIWSLTKCLAVGHRRARPQIFARVSTSPISSLCWDGEGHKVFVSGYDGSVRCMQLAHPDLSTTLHHSRDVCYAVGFCKQIGLPIMERPELDDIRPVDFVDGKFHANTLYSHLGRIRALSLSPHHPFIATGGTDGSVRVANIALARKERTRKTLKADYVMTIFRLDRNRAQSTMRMIENIAPLPATYSSQHAGASTVAWDPSISLTSLRWNPNEAKECWLSSAMACGLVRIDVVSYT